MSLWLPRSSTAILSRSYSRPLVRSLLLHRYQYSKLPSTTNATPRPLDPAPPSPLKPSPPTQRDPTQASLVTRAWKKVKHEVAHYWSGTKLLVSEVRISSRLQWKILQGETLTRRERRQAISTLQLS